MTEKELPLMSIKGYAETHEELKRMSEKSLKEIHKHDTFHQNCVTLRNVK